MSKIKTLLACAILCIVATFASSSLSAQCAGGSCGVGPYAGNRTGWGTGNSCCPTGGCGYNSSCPSGGCGYSDGYYNQYGQGYSYTSPYQYGQGYSYSNYPTTNYQYGYNYNRGYNYSSSNLNTPTSTRSMQH